MAHPVPPASPAPGFTVPSRVDGSGMRLGLAPALTAIVQRGQADIARLLGPLLLQHAPEAELSAVLAALLAVKARNARTAILSVGAERALAPSAAVQEEISVMLEDHLAIDPSPAYARAVRHLAEAWGAPTAPGTLLG